jgi:hypothetical protein
MRSGPNRPLDSLATQRSRPEDEGGSVAMWASLTPMALTMPAGAAAGGPRLSRGGGGGCRPSLADPPGSWPTSTSKPAGLATSNPSLAGPGWMVSVGIVVVAAPSARPEGRAGRRSDHPRGCWWMASLASRYFARTITQREDVADSGQSAMATTGQILLTAQSRNSSRPPRCRGANTAVCAIRRATYSAKLGAFSMTRCGRAAS